MKKLVSTVLAIVITAVLLTPCMTITAGALLQDYAESLPLNKQKAIYLGDENDNVFKVNVGSKGMLRISLDTDASFTYVEVYNSNGNILELNNARSTTGSWSSNSYDTVAHLIYNSNIGKAKGYVEYSSVNGLYYIKVYATNSSSKGKLCNVKVTHSSSDGRAATDMLLTTTIKKGSTLNLGIALTPSNSSSKVTWKSSNSKVAKVSKGKVTAVAAGTAVITAKANGMEITVRVKVT